ncbi:MAG: hypothetical protein WC936_07015 [Candidatus Nanoarchaeia archaeon]|jgi:hypothetical protein
MNANIFTSLFERRKANQERIDRQIKAAVAKHNWLDGWNAWSLAFMAEGFVSMIALGKIFDGVHHDISIVGYVVAGAFYGASLATIVIWQYIYEKMDKEASL